MDVESESDEYYEAIKELLIKIKELSKEKPSRELSLVITKLQEALMWYHEHFLGYR